MFEYIADLFIAVLVPFLALSAAVLFVMLVYLVLHRAVDEVQFKRRKRLTQQYRPVVDALLQPEHLAESLAAIAAVSAHHGPILEAMLLKLLAVSTGSVVDRLSEGARVAGLVEVWIERLASYTWWVRADSARALGLVRNSGALPLIFRALDDDHEEVRAAAVDALGLIGHEEAIPVLLNRLGDESRYQRVRIVEALREFGDAATPALVKHAHDRPADAAMVADILGFIGGHVAAEELKTWMTNTDTGVRGAALRSLGSIGLDDEGVTIALKALDDHDASVRAAAARAIGRARRQDAAPRLASHLDDEWIVAASSADALRRLGRPGQDALKARVDDPGRAGDLARQMLWERRTGTGEV
jgi:hypothetical protein